MVFVRARISDGALLGSFASDPGVPGDGNLVRAIDRDFTTWVDTDWDPGTRDAKSRPPVTLPYALRGEVLSRLDALAADLAAIKAKLAI